MNASLALSDDRAVRDRGLPGDLAAIVHLLENGETATMLYWRMLYGEVRERRISEAEAVDFMNHADAQIASGAFSWHAAVEGLATAIERVAPKGPAAFRYTTPPK